MSGEVVSVCNGQISVTVKGNSGEVWLPADLMAEEPETVAKEAVAEETNVVETCVEEMEMNADVAEEKEMETAAESDVSDVTEESDADKAEAKEEEPVMIEEAELDDEPEEEEKKSVVEEETPKAPKSYEEMSIEELQEAILERMRRNGPITDQMRKDVRENVYHNSLLNWIRSFH